MLRRRSSPFPVLPRVGIVVCAGLVLAACSSDTLRDADGRRISRVEHLELYCQTRDCVCVDDEGGIFLKRDPVDPSWRQSGEPYCPAGFALEPKTD